MEQNGMTLTNEQQTHNKNATTAMVLGIVSIVIAGFPIAGLVLAIIGLSIATSNRKRAEAGGFRENNMNTAGMVCSVVGLIAGILVLVLSVVAIVFGVVVLDWFLQQVVAPAFI